MKRSRHQVGSWIRKERRRAIYERDQFRCVYCGKSLFDDEGVRLTLDHLVPKAIGGGNECSNLVTACHVCNSLRRESSVGEFIAVLARMGVKAESIRKRVRNAVRRVCKGSNGKRYK